jgi:hypothetical protein
MPAERWRRAITIAREGIRSRPRSRASPLREDVAFALGERATPAGDRRGGETWVGHPSSGVDLADRLRQLIGSGVFEQEAARSILEGLAEVAGPAARRAGRRAVLPAARERGLSMREVASRSASHRRPSAVGIGARNGL